MRGSFAFEKGAVINVPLEGGATTEVETMTVGANAAYVFVGVGGPIGETRITMAGSPTRTPGGDSVGLALGNVAVGVLTAKETKPVGPAKYTALKVSATSAGLVGTGSVITVTAKGIDVGFSTVSSPSDTALTPAPAINFSAMNGGAGLSIATGGTPVALDFAGRIMRASVNDLTLAVSQFIYLRGSFAFEKGGIVTVPLAGGGRLRSKQ